jgi:hypothetical protein
MSTQVEITCVQCANQFTVPEYVLASRIIEKCDPCYRQVVIPLKREEVRGCLLAPLCSREPSLVTY